MAKRILILGIGPNAARVVRKARALGFYTVAMDADAQSPILEAADEAHVGNSLDVGEIVGVARDAQVDGLYAPPEPAVTAAARAAAQLGLAGIGLETATLTRNKLAMREAFAAHGVPNPPFRAVGSAFEAGEAGRALGLPVIVKPTDSSRGVGVRRVDRIEEMSLAYTRAIRSSGIKTVLLEAVMAGDEFSVDAVAQDGAIQFGAVVGRAGLRPPICVYEGVFAPPPLDDPGRAALLEAAGEALRALGVVNGCVHVEAIVTRAGPRVIEVAAYPAATWLPQDVAALAGGADGVANALRWAVGEGPFPARVCDRGAALYWIPARSGGVSEVRGLEAARAVEGVQDGVMIAQPGDVMGHVVDCPTRDRVGYVVAMGASAAAAVAAAKRARARCELVTSSIYE